MLQKSNCCVEAVSLKKWFLSGTLSSPKLKPPEKLVIYARREIFIWKRGIFRVPWDRLLSYSKKRGFSWNDHSSSFVVTRCHSLSPIVIRCQSLSIVMPLLVTRCHTLNQSLSPIVLLVAIRFHSLQFVVIRCTTRCHLMYQSSAILQTNLKKSEDILSKVCQRWQPRFAFQKLLAIE